MSASVEDPVQEAIESLVVADLGRGSTRAYLLERIAGSFRFIAKAEGPTTADGPIDDLTVGWQRLLRQLEWDSGRRLAETNRLLMPQQERGDGVDSLVVCSTIAAPLRVAVLEVGGNPVSSSLTEALKRTYTRLYHVVVPGKTKDTNWVSGQAEALRRFRPEILVLLVGDDDVALPRLEQLLRQTVADGGNVSGIDFSIVVADPAVRDKVAGPLGRKSKAHYLTPGDRTPAEIVPTVERELLDAYRARLQTPDFLDLSQDAATPPMVRSHAVDLVNRYIARAFGRQVLTVGIDDGAHVHWAAGEEAAMVTLPQVDVGPMITGLTSREVTDAARWLPFPVEDDELLTWTLNRAVRPWTVPTQPRDALIEQALARQVARRTLAELNRGFPLALPGADLIIGGPWFARSYLGQSDEFRVPGAAALALLDSVDVVPNQGVLDLALDQDGLMAVAGALGSLSPGFAADIFEYDGLIHLGSAVVIGGATHDGDLACRGELEYETGELTSFSVASGSLEVLPLRPGETASLVLRPERRYSVGGHPSGKPVTLSGDRRIIGGAVGVIIDARGRSLAAGAKERPTKVKQWLDAVNGVVQSSLRRS